MTIAAGGAFLIGHGEEGAAVVFLFFIAESLEKYAEERTKSSVASLIELAPETARVKKGGEERKVPVHKVKVGELVVIRPGDKIPLDGIVVNGSSSVNQAPITGESVAVFKRKGDEVFAGTINEEGYLEVKVTKSSKESTLSKIVKLVEEAREKKSATEKFIDRFARFYTPAVILFALTLGIVPTLIFGLPFAPWIYRALVFLVISCPCALAISTPVSMVSGITSAARWGVLIKGGSYIEEIRKVKVVAFDKTGTLTLGKPEVIEVTGLNGYPSGEVLKIAASLESLSKHPIARAIIKRAKEEKIELVDVENFKSISGKGIKGKIGNTNYYTGSKSLFFDSGIDLPAEVEKMESEGRTVTLLGDNQRILGLISLMDEVKQDAGKLIRKLKKKGIKAVMLTGDNKKVARAVANKIGIDKYYAELLPQDKVKVVENLLTKYEHVVMVGDGVNDAPALAKAHVGIAMGAAGSDVAIEMADVALMQDDLSKVSYLIELSKKTMRVVKQNVLASILIKGSFAALTFPGLITLWLAVAVGDMGLSLAVILNALRIGRQAKV
jgi:Cd2+/Zn2+-exporting ATPase